MALSVKLWQRFEVSVNGVVHSGGSLTSANTITTGADEIIDKTIAVPTGLIAIQIWALSDLKTSGIDADFIWIENEDATNFVWIQITVDAGGTDGYLTFRLNAGDRLVFPDGSAQLIGMGIDQLDGTADQIEEIWALANTSAVKVRVVTAG
jgi:hypothetical protein